MREENKGKERKDRKEGGVKGEKLSTLAGLMNGSAYRCTRGYFQQGLRKIIDAEVMDGDGGLPRGVERLKCRQ